MAKVIKGNITSTVGLYPWEQWLDGRQWECAQGVDFTCSLTTFRISVRRAAERRGLRVITRSLDKRTMRFQVKKQQLRRQGGQNNGRTGSLRKARA